MSNVRSYTDLELIERVESLPSFKGWKVGKYFFCVRSSEDEFNKFDDKGYPFEVFVEGQRPKFIAVYPITTNAGAQGLKRFETYQKLGCAVAIADHITYGSHVYGLHGKSQYPAYVQTFKGEQYPYTRDNDRDDKAENYGKIYTDRIGMNIHKAGVDTAEINGNSTACWVFKRSNDFNKFLTWANKLPINGCILAEF